MSVQFWFSNVGCKTDVVYVAVPLSERFKPAQGIPIYIYH